MKNAFAKLVYVAAFAQLFTSAVFADDAKPTFDLQSHRKVGQTDKVVVLMEVSGEFKEKATSAQGAEQRIAMSGTDRLTYYEKTLETVRDRRRSVRYYENAKSVVKFKDDSHSPSLGADRRLVGAVADASGAVLFSLQEPMTRDELEVIDILGNSLLLDDLLPDRPVAVGDVWEQSDKVMAALLGLNDATQCHVQCTLKEVNETVARVEMTGSLEGPINDTSAKIELKAKYRFDLRTHRIDWFALVTRENRGISQVADGFNLGVRLQMTITQEESPELAAAKLDGLDPSPSPERSRLAYQSPQDRWQITYDRRWYLSGDDRENAILKRIDRSGTAGQCNIASLPQRNPDLMVSLEEFQEDVRKALGKSFGEFVAAKQSVTAANYRVLRVVAQGTIHGKATDVPIRWIYYHVADRRGRQAALTFTIEQDQVDPFGDADREIVESLRFAEPAPTGKT